MKKCVSVEHQASSNTQWDVLIHDIKALFQALQEHVRPHKLNC